MLTCFYLGLRVRRNSCRFATIRFTLFRPGEPYYFRVVRVFRFELSWNLARGALAAGDPKFDSFLACRLAKTSSSELCRLCTELVVHICFLFEASAAVPPSAASLFISLLDLGLSKAVIVICGSSSSRISRVHTGSVDFFSYVYCLDALLGGLDPGMKPHRAICASFQLLDWAFFIAFACFFMAV